MFCIYIGLDYTNFKGTPLVENVVKILKYKGNKILLVQEGMNFCYGKWNLYVGKLDFGEKSVDAAKREAFDKTGFSVEIKGLMGIYNFINERGGQVIMFNFISEIIGGEIKFDGKEILNIKWFSFDEIKTMDDKELREAEKLRKILRDAEEGKSFPLEGLQELF